MKELTKMFGSLLALLITSVLLVAQTDIAEGDVSGIWTFDGSPYMIKGDITVPNDKILTIDPGVELIFTGHYRFDVKGQLLAIGSIDSMITFTAQSSVYGWHGLRFRLVDPNNDTSKVIYCKLERGIHAQGEIGGEAGGCISIENSDKIIIARNFITNNKVSGDLYSGGGGISIKHASPIVTQNLITGNKAVGGHGGGIAVIENQSAPIITNNIIYNNQAFGGGGVVVARCAPIFINNTIVENRANHGGGMDCITGSPTFFNTIFSGNDATLEGDQITLSFVDDANFINCFIEGGKEAFGQDHQQNGCPDCTGRYENNLEVDPPLTNMPEDFMLDDSSSCIGSGTQQIDINGKTYAAPVMDYNRQARPRPVGSMPDIGAIEHDLGEVISTIMMENSRHTSGLIQIFPNPTDTHSWFQYKVNHPCRVTLQIIDLKGKHILTLLDGYKNAGDHRQLGELGQLSDGLYLCVMTADGIVSTGTIVIQN